MVEGARILVVDDEQAVREMFRKFLSHKGFTVLTAANALEGLRIQKREQLDLVLTDYHMPEVNGVEMMRDLHLADPNLPIILMSGQADMRTAAGALREAAFDFLSKPINSDELLRTIRAALGRKRAAEIPLPEESATAAGRLVGPIFVSTGKGRPDIAILSFHRALDQHSQRQYEVACTQIENEVPFRGKLIIALKSVSYINNVGLNLLLDTYARWQSQKRAVVMAELSEPVHSYLKMLGYLDYFPVGATVQDAMNMLG